MFYSIANRWFINDEISINIIAKMIYFFYHNFCCSCMSLCLWPQDTYCQNNVSILGFIMMGNWFGCVREHI